MNIKHAYSPAGWLTLALLVVVAGCASIVSGTRQKVQIRSNPTAAQVTVERPDKKVGMETVWQGTTPATVNLKRKHSYLVTVSLDGYEPVEVGMDRGTNGWVWGNLVFGGLLGVVIDMSNGASRKLKPNEIYVDLYAVRAAAPDQPDEVYAVLQGLDEEGNVRSLPVPMVPLPPDSAASKE